MTYDFDEFSVSGDALEGYAYSILDMLGMVKRLHTPQDRLKLFVKRVRTAYLDNPYHCWAHGFMVMRTTSMLVQSCPHVKLSAPERCAVAIAGMCHDIAHPGKNNAFETKVKSALAIRYNDKSVYEMMHAATTFEILSDPAADVFATLTMEKRAEMRKLMIQAILMTDMASHFDLAKKLESRVAMLSPDAAGAGAAADPPFKDSPEDKQLLIDLILHSADIGAQVLPVPIANKWSQAVLEEFQEVHEAEKQAGVALTPFIIGLDEPLRAANCQFGFINFIVKPLWTNLLKFIPDVQEELITNLNGNVDYWKAAVDANTPGKQEEEEQKKSGGEAKIADEAKEKGDGEAASAAVPAQEKGNEAAVAAAAPAEVETTAAAAPMVDKEASAEAPVDEPAAAADAKEAE